MQRITIERYPNPDDLGFSGLIEGTRDDGTTWIMWLDEVGSPVLFWADRDESGAAWGDPIRLDAATP